MELTPQNFRPIYEEYLPKIYRFVYYRVRHKQTAEDLTSTIFLKVVQNISSYRPGPVGIGPWLYKIARNAVIDHSRTSKPTADLAEAEHVASGHDVLASADQALKLEWVQGQLSALTEIQREVLTLRVWDNLSHREISETLGISESNSKVSLSRALSALKGAAPLVILAIFNLKGTL